VFADDLMRETGQQKPISSIVGGKIMTKCVRTSAVALTYFGEFSLS